jgi:hypothetical protein
VSFAEWKNFGVISTGRREWIGSSHPTLSVRTNARNTLDVNICRMSQTNQQIVETLV